MCYLYILNATNNKRTYWSCLTACMEVHDRREWKPEQENTGERVKKQSNLIIYQSQKRGDP